MNGTFYHSRCIAHIINLAMQNGLNIPSVQKFYEAFKIMLKDVFRSNKRRHGMYKKLCMNLNSEYLGPNCDVPTRVPCYVLNTFMITLHLRERLFNFRNRIGMIFRKSRNFLEYLKTRQPCCREHIIQHRH